MSAVVTVAGGRLTSVHIASAEVWSEGSTGVAAQTGAPETVKAPPNPVLPEGKEIAWGAGTFLVLLVVVRFALFPKLKAGMDARYKHIRDSHEGAEALRAKAHAEVAEYEASLATIRAEANGKLDAARQTLEGERTAKIAEVNARINERRAASLAGVAAAKESAGGQIAGVVSDVASSAAAMVLGRPPSPDALRTAVDHVMSAGAKQ